MGTNECHTRNVIVRIQGEVIPSLQDSLIKALGKWYDDSLGDHRNVNHVKTLAFTWLTNVDKSGLPGKYKAWIYQHGIMASHTFRDHYIHDRGTREDIKPGAEQMAKWSTKFQFHSSVQQIKINYKYLYH